jgi:hypothetical protein
LCDSPRQNTVRAKKRWTRNIVDLGGFGAGDDPNIHRKIKESRTTFKS